MKLVKENIDEKFTEKSDPVDDMGIGIGTQFKKWLEEVKNNPSTQWNLNTIDSQLTLCAYIGKTEFVKYLIDKGADVHHSQELPLRSAAFMKHYDTGKLLIEKGANYKDALSFCRQHNYADTIYGIKQILKEMGHGINEKFEEQGDPLNDMGIGLKKIVHEWINKYNNVEVKIDNISLNKDEEIDFNGYLLFMHTPNFPDYIKFNRISNNFEMHHNEDFTSLKGFPKYVGRDLKFYNNAIKPTEEEIRAICDVKGEVQLIDDWSFKQKKSIDKYKRLGPVLSRPSPRIDDKTPKMEQKWSRGYHLWKMLDYIQKSGNEGRRYKEMVKFDDNFKNLTYARRTLSTGVFNSLKHYTDKSMRNLYHRYVISKGGEQYLERYRKAFDDGRDFSKGPVKESINEKFIETSDPLKDMGIGIKTTIKNWFIKSFDLPEEDFNKYVLITKNNLINLKRSGLRVTKNALDNGELPEFINFGIVDGDFDISHAGLTSLRGTPRVIKGNFNCEYNELSSLDHAPKIIKLNANFKHNREVFYEADVREKIEVGGQVFDY